MDKKQSSYLEYLALEWWQCRGTVVEVLGPAIEDFHIPQVGMRNSVLWYPLGAKTSDGRVWMRSTRC